MSVTIERSKISDRDPNSAAERHFREVTKVTHESKRPCGCPPDFVVPTDDERRQAANQLVAAGWNVDRVARLFRLTPKHP